MIVKALMALFIFLKIKQFVGDVCDVPETVAELKKTEDLSEFTISLMVKLFLVGTAIVESFLIYFALKGAEII